MGSREVKPTTPSPRKPLPPDIHEMVIPDISEIHYKINRATVAIFNLTFFKNPNECPERKGSDYDAKLLHDIVIKKFGFAKDRVKVYDSKKASFTTMSAILEQIAGGDHTDDDCFICVVLTHGESGMLHSYDKMFPTKLLWQYFVEKDHCNDPWKIPNPHPSWRNKPKVFIIQACRGTGLDDGVDVHYSKSVTMGDDVDGGPTLTSDPLRRRGDSETDHKKGKHVSFSGDSDGDEGNGSNGDECFEDQPDAPNSSTTVNDDDESSSSSDDSPTKEMKQMLLCEETPELLLHLPQSTDPQYRKNSEHAVPSYTGSNNLLAPPPTSGRRTSLPTNIREQLVQRSASPNRRASTSDKTDGNKESDSQWTKDIFTYPDLLVAYSTLDGFYSFRSPQTGSWFIQALCNAIEDSTADEDLITILTRVNHFVSAEKSSYVTDPRKKDFHGKKQMPCVVSTLTKLLYLHKDAKSV